jgi:hypothetical protein
MVKTGFYGYSWTYLFFGWFVPLYRGELGVGALHLLFTIVTGGIWQLIVSFLYNKQYMTRMLTNGWVLDGSDSDLSESEFVKKAKKPFNSDSEDDIRSSKKKVFY